MDKFLGAFSLQNFLRQFFCGVVFFVPFFLYGQTPLAAWLESGQDNPDWCAPKVAALGVLACIVGTIIYHFEKNLYSYGIQCIFEWGHAKIGGWLAWLLICTVIAIIIVCFAWDVNSRGLLWMFLVLSLIFSLICLTYTSLQDKTRRQWVAEEICISDDSHNYLTSYIKGIYQKVPSSAIPMIAARIAKWSDFIHCVQSCCFAWLLGGAIVESTTCACCCGCPCSAEQIPSCHAPYVLIILAFEALFDWHRYQHVLSITENNNQ